MDDDGHRLDRDYPRMQAARGFLPAAEANKRDIELAVPKRMHYGLGMGLAHTQLDAGVILAEATEEPGEDHRRCLHAAKRQPSGHQSLQRRERVTRSIGAGKNRAACGSNTRPASVRRTRFGVRSQRRSVSRLLDGEWAERDAAQRHPGL